MFEINRLKNSNYCSVIEDAIKNQYMKVFVLESY